MVKNNLLSLVFHGLLCLVIFSLIWFTKDQLDLVALIFGSIPGKLGLGLLIILYYFFTARLLRTKSLVDVFTSSLLVLSLGFFFVFLAYGGLGDQVLRVKPAQSLWILPYTIFSLPMTCLAQMISLRPSLEVLILVPLMPALIYALSQGLYLRKRRKKMSKRQENHKRRTYV